MEKLTKHIQKYTESDIVMDTKQIEIISSNDSFQSILLLLLFMIFL